MKNLNRSNLHHYQERGVDWIVNRPRCGLFLSMGLGKTITTLTAISDLYDSGHIKRVLVFGPKRVIESVWLQEAAKWEHTKHLKISVVTGTPKKRVEKLNIKADVYLISVGNVAWLCEQYGLFSFDMVVIDESSTFKNRNSKRFKAFRRVSPRLRRLVLLTGTPAPNGLIDLWSQIYLIDQGARLGSFIGQYRDRYFTPGQRRGHIVFNYNLKRGADKRIYEKIGDLCMSMKTEDYLELPARIDNFIKVPLSVKTKATYNRMKKDSIVELSHNKVITAAHAVTLANKLTQIANGCVYDEHGNISEIHTHKMDALSDIVESVGGKPLIIAYTYRSDLSRILEKFHNRGAKALLSDADIIDWNAGKIPILLLHPASGGHGLNLQYGGSTLVWYGQTWNLELYQQMNARIHRQGQTETVIVHHLISEGTIDERIVRMLRGKASKQNSLLDALKYDIEKVKNITP